MFRKSIFEWVLLIDYINISMPCHDPNCSQYQKIIKLFTQIILFKIDKNKALSNAFLKCMSELLEIYILEIFTKQFIKKTINKEIHSWKLF